MPATRSKHRKQAGRWSDGLGAMKQPLAVVTRTSRRLLFFKFESRTAPDAVIPSHIDPFNGPFEVADAANARYTAVDAAPHSPVVGEFFQREAPGH